MFISSFHCNVIAKSNSNNRALSVFNAVVMCLAVAYTNYYRTASIG